MDSAATSATKTPNIEAPPEVRPATTPLPLAGILDAVRDPVCILDHGCRYLYVNPPMQALAGANQQQLLGRSIWEVFPERTGTEFEAAARRALSEQQQIVLQCLFPKLDRWYEHRLHPIPEGLLIFTTDIDDRKRADEYVREGEKRYRHLFDVTNDGILIVNDEGRYVDVNESYCRILKTSRERLIGAHFSEFMPAERLEEAFQAFADLKSGRPTPVEFPLQALDGSIVQLEWSSVSHYLPGLSFCICRDITESRRAAASLRAAQGAIHESEERFRAIFDRTPECVKLVAPDGTLLQMNSSGIAMIGAACAEDVIGRSVYDLIAPEYRAAWIKFHESICSGEKDSLQFDIVGLDGKRRHVESHAAPLRQPDGTVAHLAITHDVTERKRREQITLLLGAIVDSSNDAIISKDLNGVITSWNKGAERTFGYSAAEAVGKPITMLMPPDRLNEGPDILAQIKQGEGIEHFETIRTRKDGARLNMSLTISPIRDGRDNIVGASKIARDISGRKRAETAIRELNAQLASELSAMKRMQQLSTRLVQADDFIGLLSEIVDAGIEITGADMGNIQLLEDGALKIVSQRGFEAPFLDFFNTVHGGVAACGTAMESRDRVIVEDVADSPVFSTARAREVMLAAGARAVQSTPLISRAGHMQGMFSTHYRVPHRPAERDLRLLDLLARQAADLIERKRAESSLLASEQRFRQLADTMPQMVWTARPDGYLDYYNERWYEFTGFNRYLFGDSSWEPILHPDDVKRCYDGWYGSVGRGEPFQIELRFWDRNEKRWRWFIGRALPVRNPDGDIVKWFGTCTDIDEQKRVEDELRRANRDLEQFAYSASHDLQEPLRGIKLYGELLARRCGDKLDRESTQFLDYLRKSATRMEMLLRDLLAYSQAGVLDAPLATIDSNEAFQSALANLAGAIARSGAVVTCDSLPAVRIHGVHLGQLFQNLIANAIKYRSLDRAPEVHVSAERQGNNHVFAVRDNGIGIDPEYREYIFGLFKRLSAGDESSGTGIGLAICQRIVEHYDGRIWVESDPGHGSTFRFELPI